MQTIGLRVHMVGIGGAGMSSLARYLRDGQALVTGSDSRRSSIFESLAREGFQVAANQDSSNVDRRADLAIHTAAVSAQNPEMRACIEQGIPVLKYSEMLGRIMENHLGIAVAGTHGKTTVAAMTAFLLRQCGLDPSFVIGGDAACLGDVGGARGSGKHLVVEACEFSRSFLDLKPSVAVITNIEEDHLDYYRDLDDLREAFGDFIGRCREGAELIASDSIPDLDRLAESFTGEVLTFGFSEQAVFRAVDLSFDRARSTFDLNIRGDAVGSLRISRPGRHNVLNALAAVAAALRAGCALEQIRGALPAFEGVARRMEMRGRFGSITLYSDYAHHPSEIACVSESLRLVHPGQRLVTVYQAHQRTRTAHFLGGLAATLAAFDLALVVETFSVREQNVDHLPGGRELSDAVANRNGQSYFIGTKEDAQEKILSYLKRDDVLVLMGAGDIDEIAQSLGETLRSL